MDNKEQVFENEQIKSLQSQINIFQTRFIQECDRSAKLESELINKNERIKELERLLDIKEAINNED